MKKRKSFIKRHMIGIIFLLLVGVYSGYSVYEKQQTLKALANTSEERIEEIRLLKENIDRLESDIEQMDTLDFAEKYAREKFKMVRPDEIYFQMLYNYEEDGDD